MAWDFLNRGCETYALTDLTSACQPQSLPNAQLKVWSGAGDDELCKSAEDDRVSTMSTGT